MKKSIILINKNFFILNNKEYDFDKINEINHLLKSNLKIVILEENLYVKQFTWKAAHKGKRQKINEFVDYKINNEFPQTGDLLYDFEKNDNNIAIYSMKGAKRVECLSKKADNLEVKPIQFIIKEIMFKRLKKSDFNAQVLIKFNECYYYACFKNGLFNFGLADENKDSILNTVLQEHNTEEIYIDHSIANIICSNDKLKIIKLNLGELINEKIYEKQRFHSRKILFQNGTE